MSGLMLCLLPFVVCAQTGIDTSRPATNVHGHKEALGPFCAEAFCVNMDEKHVNAVAYCRWIHSALWRAVKNN